MPQPPRYALALSTGTPQRAERDALVEVRERLAALPAAPASCRHQIVALDVRDRRPQPEPLVERARRAASPAGFRPPALTTIRMPRSLARDRAPPRAGAGRCARSPASGSLQPILQQDHQRQLGEVVAGEHVDRTALDHLARRAQAVAVEAAAVRDAEHVGHATPRLTRGSADRSTCGGVRLDPARLALLRERGHALGRLGRREQLGDLRLGVGERRRPSRRRDTVRTSRLASRDGDRAALARWRRSPPPRRRRGRRRARRGAPARTPAPRARRSARR